ncbi:MAG: L-glutamate gamma-semialdehyde dehydrogenase [Candidatus Bipolaricaulia bacterium]
MATTWIPDLPDNEMDKALPYAPGTAEREALLEQIGEYKKGPEEIPLVIGGEPVESDEIRDVRSPHDHNLVLGRSHQANEDHIRDAIESALAAKAAWEAMDPYERAAVFYRAADLAAGPRRTELIAASMLNQSKNPYEAEIDLGELVDFWRFNAYYMKQILESQPKHIPNEFNRVEWRPLEGFVFAAPPFNFLAIGANVPSAPAVVGNVALWKPSPQVIHINYKVMQVLQEAGLPDGVINFIPFPEDRSDVVFEHPDLAGLSFTGSYDTLVKLWQKISDNLPKYKSFPRIVGEAGGKDFIVVHPSANLDEVTANAIRGAFGYQGQKCSAASRMYVPESLWGSIQERLQTELDRLQVGPTENLDNYMGAVIDGAAFEKISGYIEHAKSHPDTYEFVHGGDYDDSQGWFIQPTVIRSHDPKAKLMAEEDFGPLLTVYVYPDDEYEEALELCDQTSSYSLTGAVFARDRGAIVKAEGKLKYAAGNFYINDKPTGSIPGRQPFGGARHSGTNDKTGFWTHLIRWMNPRSIKETRVPARDWPHPFMGDQA